MIIMDIWSNMTSNFPQYATDAYAAINPWFYPLLFLGIIGYVYAYMRSATVAMVAIFILFGIWGVSGIYLHIDGALLRLIIIICIITLAGLVHHLLLGKKRFE